MQLHVNVLQVWLIAGIPAIVVALLLFLAPSPSARLAGYLVLAGGFAVVAALDRVSAAVFGGALALLYAAGQGRTRPVGDLGDDGDQPSLPSV